MTDEELRQLEAEWGVLLPERYRQIVTSYPEELRNWPEGPEAPRKSAFALTLNEVQAANKAGRKIRRREFPAKGFVIGGDRDGWWMIDTILENPPVQLILREYTLDGFDDLDDLLRTVRADHAEAWAKANKRPVGAKKPSLALEALIAEAEKLARPAVALRKKGSDRAAIWRGTGVVSPGPGEWRHWISIDTRFLPQNPGGRTGVISLYEWFADDERMGELKVAHDPTESLPAKTDGTNLFAHAIDCPPDVDAVFHFGSQSLRDWLEATSWNPDVDYDRPPVKDYLPAMRRRHPFSAGDGTYAMLGGWSWCFNWCYGIDEEYPWHLLELPLVVLTLQDSEPWIEVFDAGENFEAYSRIT